MNFLIFILIFLLLFSVLGFIEGIKTYWIKRKLSIFIKNKSYNTVENLHCSFTTIGMRKRYPGASAKIKVFLMKDRLLITGQYSFFNFFQASFIPLLLKKGKVKNENDDQIFSFGEIESLNIGQAKIRVKFSDHKALIKTKVDYTIGFTKDNTEAERKIIKNWFQI